MTLAIFDLDNTLLRGDSDYAWGQFLIEQGALDRAEATQAHDRFYTQHLAGTLDIDEFLRFQLAPLAAHGRRQLERWRRQFVRRKIRPMITTAARALVDSHLDQGHIALIITATNRFITEPIAAEFGVAQLIATDPEEQDGRYTGLVRGIPCYREGKVARLRQWLAESGQPLAGSTFYSDSHNDLPLLELVDHPVAVNPDATLADHARRRGWPILELD